MEKSKIDVAVKMLSDEIASATSHAKNLDMAITIRKQTVNRLASDIRGLKTLRRKLNQEGASTRYLAGLLLHIVGDYNTHVSILPTLKQRHHEALEEIYLKGLILKELGHVGGVQGGTDGE